MSTQSTQFKRILLSFLICSSVSGAYAQEMDSETTRFPDGMWGGQTPSPYKILPRPATHSNKGQPHTYLPPANQIHSQPVQPYAYGWFGTRTSTHWARQFGYQKAYTQWTLK